MTKNSPRFFNKNIFNQLTDLRLIYNTPQINNLFIYSNNHYERLETTVSH